MPNPSMHCGYATVASSPVPLNREPSKDRLDVVIGGGLTKRLVGQISRSLKQRVCDFFVHLAMLPRDGESFYPHFPSPPGVVDVTTVGQGHANKNVRGAFV